MPSVQLIEAIAVTAELCGRTFSEAAARVFVSDLSGYPEPAVMKALTRCRKEVRGVLTVSDVVTRIEDGRPGADEAWAMVPMSERDSAVWTKEMSYAYGIAVSLIEAGDKVAARMAFKEAYKRAVDEARDAGEPVEWSASLGHDSRGREFVIRRAEQLGRLTTAQAYALLPDAEMTDSAKQIASDVLKRIGSNQ